MSRFFSVLDGTETLQIDDENKVTDKTWSSFQIGKELDKKADVKVMEDELDKKADKTTIGDMGDLPSDLLGKTVSEILAINFTNGVNRKAQVVTAINSKGETVTANDTWDTIVNAINNIKIQTSTGDNNIINISKLNIVGSSSSPYIKKISLTNPIIDKRIITGLREFVPGTEQTNLLCDFNNGDVANFTSKFNRTVFDGKMHLNPITVSSTMNDEGTSALGHNYSFVIDKSQFNTIDKIECTDQSITVSGANYPDIIIANGDIDISGVQDLEQIIFSATAFGAGKVLLAISTDSGNTYKAYNQTTSIWETVDINNLTDFNNKGMNKTVTDALTTAINSQLIGSSNKIRFAYYISQSNLSDTAYTDSISIKVFLKGHNELANKNDYDVKIGSDNNSVEFYIYKNGTFTFDIANL